MSELAGETGEVVDGAGESGAEQSSFAISQEEWESTQAQLAEANQYIQQTRAQQQSQSSGPLDDYDPEFRQALDQYIDQRLSPYNQFQQDAVMSEAEQRAQDILSDISKSGDEFDIATARLRADQLLPDMIARYGQGPKAAEAALQAAAEAQRGYEAQVRQQAVEQYQNQLRGISGAPREPAASGTNGAVQHVTPEGGNEQDLVRAYFPTRR